MEQWIVSCNCKYYDVIGAFSKNKSIDWKQSCSSINAGDEVFIYVGKPYQDIMYRCKVNKVNLKNISIDDSEFIRDKVELNGKYGRYMELELIEIFDDHRYSLDKLQKKGLRGTIQGPRKAYGILD